MAVAAASLPLLAKPIAQALNQPVIGWERTIDYTKGRKRLKVVHERSSFQLRAWELAAVGLATVAAYYVVTRPDQTTPSPVPASTGDATLMALIPGYGIGRFLGWW